MFENPGITHLLPPDFEVVNSPNHKGSKVVLPIGHQMLIHTCRDYKRKDGRFGQYILMLCINKEKIDCDPYLLLSPIQQSTSNNIWFFHFIW